MPAWITIDAQTAVTLSPGERLTGAADLCGLAEAWDLEESAVDAAVAALRVAPR